MISGKIKCFNLDRTESLFMKKIYTTVVCALFFGFHAHAAKKEMPDAVKKIAMELTADIITSAITIKNLTDPTFSFKNLSKKQQLHFVQYAWETFVKDLQVKKLDDGIEQYKELCKNSCFMKFSEENQRACLRNSILKNK